MTAPRVALNVPSPRVLRAWLSCLLLAFALVGCGGDGGGGDPAAAITVQAAPSSQTVVDGRSAVLAVLATSPSVLSYQWLRAGTPISGATDPVYVTPALGLADSGASFAVVLRNAAGAVTTTAAATITVSAIAPSFASQPQPQSVQPGQTASYSVVAQGSQPLAYQWQRDGVDIAGATAASYTTPAATALDAGARYRVVVRNAGGQAASDEAVLRVVGAGPVVLGILQVGVVAPGQGLRISSRLAGNPPYSYQWFRNGQPIAGAAATTEDPNLVFDTGTLREADDGTAFTFSVATAEGTALSPTALISVIATPRIAAGGAHSLARSADGNTVWAWGDNQHGQLGLGSRVGSGTPAVIAGLAGVKALAAGAGHSLALLADGSVWAWGRNDSGALGDGSRTDRLAPQRITALAGVVAIAAGNGRSFALRSDGSLWAWGDNASGALGIGSQNDSLVPAPVGSGVAGFGALVAVASGARHSLALRADGRVFAFGESGGGIATSPVLVDGLESIATVSAGDGHSVALDTQARIWVWGSNSSGQLGLGDTAPRAAPVRVASAADAATLLPTLGLAAGRDFTLSRSLDGAVLGVGAGGSGQIGGGEPAAGSSALRAVANLPSPIRQVAAGGAHALVLRSDGSVYAWGANDAGQLGIGSAEPRRAEPVQVPGLALN